MVAIVVLITPKYAHNVGGALRACAVLGATKLLYTGKRVPPSHNSKAYHLPREERLKDYRHVIRHRIEYEPDHHVIEDIWSGGTVPVAVECLDKCESLIHFKHPPNAAYVFGPEDGSLRGNVLSRCHRFVRIPSIIRSPLNLSQAVNIVLYDRLVKQQPKTRS